jgi:quercetin dioxygenase-like cupin family protein
MTTSRFIITVLAFAIGVTPAGRLIAQSGATAPTWEALVRTPLPADTEPILSVNGLTMPAQPVHEHSHPSQVVVAYIVNGRIENQIAPDPPATFTGGGFFSEAPGQLHKIMRNLDADPAKLLIFHAGRTGVPASLLKDLPREPVKLSFAEPTQWRVSIPSTTTQQLRLVQLTLPAQTRSEVAPHSGPGMIYVLEGTLTIVGVGPQAETHQVGDLFPDAANREGLIFRNMSDKARTRVLFFHVSDPQSAVQTPPMMPYLAVHEPVFVPASEATFARDDDLVIGVAKGKTVKAYMALDLGQHGSVDDRMPDGPIEVTWCSTCGTGAVFRSELNGRLLHFEYDSMVNANEVHKDVETGSRWQQSTGEAISGPLKGNTLTLYPFVLSSWKEWRTRYPNTTLLKPMPGYAERIPILRPRQKQSLTLGEGDAPAGSFSMDTRLRPRQMIAGLAIGSETMAFDVSALRVTRVVNEQVGGVPVVVIHQPLVETTTAFEAQANGKVLRFQSANAEASRLVDLDTHSTWSAYGLCLDGPMKGTQLKPLILIPEFWFAWSQFRPGTRLFTLPGGKTQ